MAVITNSSKEPIHISQLFRTREERLKTQRKAVGVDRIPKFTDMCHLYTTVYIRIKQHVEDHDYRNWCSFKFERVAVEFIPSVVDYLIYNHSPYGAHSTSDIDVNIRVYFPRFTKEEAIRLWTFIQSVVWSLLGFVRNKPQRLAYKLENGCLEHITMDVKEVFIEDALLDGRWET